MIKISILLARKEELTHEEFVKYHKVNHAPLFSSLPEVKKYVRKYVQSHILPLTFPGLPSPSYDGITEMWFENQSDAEALFSSDGYMSIIRPDEDKFINLLGCSIMFSIENPVI